MKKERFHKSILLLLTISMFASCSLVPVTAYGQYGDAIAIKEQLDNNAGNLKTEKIKKVMNVSTDVGLQNNDLSYSIKGVKLPLNDMEIEGYSVSQKEGSVDTLQTLDYDGNVGKIEITHDAIYAYGTKDGEYLQVPVITDAVSCYGVTVTKEYIYYATENVNPTSNDGFDGYNYVRTDLNGKNKEVLHYEEYSAHGTGIGIAPCFMVTADYMYVYKNGIVKIDLNTLEKTNVLPNSLDADDCYVWTQLKYVLNDNYFFYVEYNHEPYPGDQSEYSTTKYTGPGYYFYNEKTGLKKIAGHLQGGEYEGSDLSALSYDDYIEENEEDYRQSVLTADGIYFNVPTFAFTNGTEEPCGVMFFSFKDKKLHAKKIILSEDRTDDSVYAPDDDESTQDDTENTKSKITDIQYLLFSDLAYCNYKNVKKNTKLTKIADSLYKSDGTYKNDHIKSVDKSVLIKKYLKDWSFEVYYSDANLWEDGSSESGFYCVAFKNSEGQRILSFRGSQDLANKKNSNDWSDNITYGLIKEMSPQMIDAIKATAEYMDDNELKTSDISLAGHSLGGGLGIFISNLFGIDAVTYNASPTTAIGYYYAIGTSGSNFSGCDAWKCLDHVNEHDLVVGNFDYSIKNAVKHKNQFDNKLSFNAHSRDSFLVKKGDGYKLCKVIDTHEGEKFTTAVATHEITSAVLTTGLAFSTMSVNSLSTIIQLSKTAASPSVLFNAMNGIWGQIGNIFLPKGSLVMGTTRGNYLCGNMDGIAGMNSVIPHTDVMYGGDDDDVIDALIGDDYFVGGKGNDVLKSCGGNDTYFYYKGDGIDNIYDGSGKDKIYLYGFKKGDKITADNKSDDKFVLVKCNDKLIMRIRNYADRTSGNGLKHEFQIIPVVSDSTSVSDLGDHLSTGIRIYDWKDRSATCTVTVKCPVSIDAVDKNGQTLSLPNSNMDVVDLDDGTFFVKYNEDTKEYEKTMILYDTDAYKFNIDGVGKGTMDVDVLCHSEEYNMTYNAKDIPVSNNARFDMTIGDNCVPTMNSDDGKVPFESRKYAVVNNISADDKKVNIGNEKSIYPVLDCEDLSDKTVEYESSNNNIVQVNDSGKIVGIAKGKAVVSIQVDDKITQIQVTVKDNNSFKVLITVFIVAITFAVATYIAIVLKKKSLNGNNSN